MIKVKIGRCQAVMVSWLGYLHFRLDRCCHLEGRRSWRRKRRTEAETSGYRSETAAA